MDSLRNKVQLIGNLGRDPEVRQFDNGNSFARLCLATKEIYKNHRGENVTETLWHNNIIAYGKLATNIKSILKKGQEVSIMGKLTHRSYEDNDGITRYISEIVVREFVIANSNKGKGF